MVPPLRPRVVGDDPFYRRLHLLFALAMGVLTALAYADGLFERSGGIVFLPFHAALAGPLAAGVVGYDRGGLALGWPGAYAPYLGRQVTWRFRWLSGTRTLTDRLGFVLDPAGLAYCALFAAVVGGVGYTPGRLLAFGAARLPPAPNGNA